MRGGRLWLAVLALSSIAAAPAADDEALLLAATCTAEITFRGTGECVIMWDVQRRKADARGRDLALQVRLYHSVWKRTPRGRWVVNSPRAKWIRSLQATADEPAGWRQSETVPWDGERWMAMYAAAQDFLAGGALSPCPAADEYGGDCDSGRAACDPPRACWVRVDCGDTAQAYWSTKKCSGSSGTVDARLAGGREDGIW